MVTKRAPWPRLSLRPSTLGLPPIMTVQPSAPASEPRVTTIPERSSMPSSPQDRRTLRRSRPSLAGIMKLFLLIFFLSLLACGPSPRSQQSYDQLRNLVTGKTGAEVERLLGPPDLRESVLDDQRWIWWNYTFLDGNQYAPEIRGQIVHLEIVLKRPPDGTDPIAKWRALGPLAVSYSMPSRNL